MRVALVVAGIVILLAAPVVLAQGLGLGFSMQDGRSGAGGSGTTPPSSPDSQLIPVVL